VHAVALAPLDSQVEGTAPGQLSGHGQRLLRKGRGRRRPLQSGPSLLASVHGQEAEHHHGTDRYGDKPLRFKAVHANSSGHQR
jgi:hypothetical protein